MLKGTLTALYIVGASAIASTIAGTAVQTADYFLKTPEEQAVMKAETRLASPVEIFAAYAGAAAAGAAGFAIGRRRRTAAPSRDFTPKP